MIMIEVGMFATVKNSRYVDYDIQKGDLVYVAGEMMAVIDEKDPYVYRKLFVAAYMDDGHVQAERKPLSMDATNLKKVGIRRQKKLYAQFEKDFAKEE